MATASTLHGQTNLTPADKDRFSAEAASWDSNPFIHTATTAAYNAISTTVPLTNLTILEIGCGTGVLSLQTATEASHVVAVDAAPGMIDVLKTKLAGPSAPTNVTPLCLMLEDPEDPALPSATTDATATNSISNSDSNSSASARMKFDLITSHLVLHHIPDVKPVLRTMYGCLKPGGRVALTDFEDFGPEARRFHPLSRMDSVERDGIRQKWIAGLLEDVGFVDVEVKVGFRLDKSVEKFEGEWGNSSKPEDGQGEIMEFPFLICLGVKPST